MFKLKGCPKCHGDMHLNYQVSLTQDEPEWVCIQCGKRVYIPSEKYKQIMREVRVFGAA